MKALEELGISHTPWKNPNWKNNSFVFDGNNLEVAIVSGDCKDEANANATLIAAAPKLYDELWKICFGTRNTINCRTCKGAELGRCSSCLLGGARSALAEASGEATNEIV